MKVFHYTTGQGLFGILNSQQLHCSNLRFMNDPSEEYYFDQLIKELLEQEEDLKFIYETLYNPSYHKAVLNPTEKFIASFSKNGDSLPMWNYYSKGNGYNFEIDLQVTINENRREDLSIQLIELNYDKQNHLEQLNSLLYNFASDTKFYSSKMEELSSCSDDNERDYIWGATYNIIENFNELLNKLKISLKHPAYAREEEVRLLVSEYPGLKEGEKVNFKISNSGVFISYIALQMDLSKCISSITTHPLNSNLYKLGIEEFLKSDVKFKNIQVKASEVPFREI